MQLGRSVELAGCLLKQENEEKCHEALLCCTEGLKRCCAAVIQWGKDKSLTYTYAPPRERTPWAEKEQNMKYEFPRAAQEGWLSRALPPWLSTPPAWLCRDEGRPPQGRPQVGLLALPITCTCSPGQEQGPSTRGFGLWFSPKNGAPADWLCLG